MSPCPFPSLSVTPSLSTNYVCAHGQASPNDPKLPTMSWGQVGERKLLLYTVFYALFQWGKGAVGQLTPSSPLCHCRCLCASWPSANELCVRHGPEYISNDLHYIEWPLPQSLCIPPSPSAPSLFVPFRFAPFKTKEKGQEKEKETEKERGMHCRRELFE